MKNLEHKGWRGTRMQWMAILFVTALGLVVWSELKPTEFLEFMKWLFGIFATSELGAKGAEAVRDRGQTQGAPQQ